MAHLGVTAPPKSTLAYANAHRPWQLYEHAFYQLLDRGRGGVTGWWRSKR